MRAASLATLALLPACALATLALLTACGSHGSRGSPTRRSQPAVAATHTDDEVGARAEREPLPEAPPLADELGSHESLAACRTRVRGTITPDLAELLGELGYDAAPDDVCAGLDAVRRGDAAGCDRLSVSAVRRGCRRRVAVAHGTPDVCPDDPIVLGREPTCLAWASRDAGLCRGASDGDRARCEAVARNEPSRCRDAVDAAQCERDVRRFASIVAADPPGRPASDAPPTFVVTLQGPTTHVDADASATVARGVVLGSCSDLATFTLGQTERNQRLPDFVDAPTPWLDVLVHPSGNPRHATITLGGPAADASLVVVLPRHVSTTSELGAVATLSADPVRLARGAVLGGTLGGTLAADGETVRLSGRFRTFVRDVVVQQPPCRR